MLYFNKKMKKINKKCLIIIPLLIAQLTLGNFAIANNVDGLNQNFKIINFTPSMGETFELGQTIYFSIVLKNISKKPQNLTLQGMAFKCIIINNEENCGIDIKYNSGISSYYFGINQTRTIGYYFKPAEPGRYQLDIFDPPWSPGKNIARGVIINVIDTTPKFQKIKIEKTVKNINNDNDFSDWTQAETDDKIAFQLNIQSIGNQTTNNILVWDNLPYGLEYINNSTTIDSNPVDDGIVNGGIYIGTIQPGESKNIEFRAKVLNTFSYSKTITNYGYAKIVETFNTVQDIAKITITPKKKLELRFEKYVRNLNESNYDKATSVKDGEEVEFLIKIVGNGNDNANIQNIKIWDNLPPNLKYIPGSTQINGVTADDSLITDGLYIDEINNGETINITFRAKTELNGCPIFACNQTVINYAYAKISDEIKSYSSYARITIWKENQSAQITLSKMGRNISQNKLIWTDSISANPSDIIEFSLQIKSKGNITVNNVSVKDILPAQMQYLEGSATINDVPTTDDIINNGLLIGNMWPGETKTIKFKAKLLDDSYFLANTTTLLSNNATAWSINTNFVSDSATILVSHRPNTPSPTLPPPQETVLGAATVRTGPEDSLFLIAVFSLILTLMLFIVLDYLKSKGLISNLKLKWLILKMKIKEKNKLLKTVNK